MRSVDRRVWKVLGLGLKNQILTWCLELISGFFLFSVCNVKLRTNHTRGSSRRTLEREADFGLSLWSHERRRTFESFGADDEFGGLKIRLIMDSI